MISGNIVRAVWINKVTEDSSNDAIVLWIIFEELLNPNLMAQMSGEGREKVKSDYIYIE